MKEAYKKCMKEKNTIKIKSYESPCGVLLLGSFGGKLCLCDWQVEKHCDRVNPVSYTHLTLPTILRV